MPSSFSGCTYLVLKPKYSVCVYIYSVFNKQGYAPTSRHQVKAVTHVSIPSFILSLYQTVMYWTNATRNWNGKERSKTTSPISISLDLCIQHNQQIEHLHLHSVRFTGTFKYYQFSKAILSPDLLIRPQIPRVSWHSQTWHGKPTIQ
jgi:hypothetical protein